MSDYQPDTDAIRERYVNSRRARTRHTLLGSLEAMDAESTEEFDRWLAVHDLAHGNARLDDLSAGVPDDVRDWIDEYRNRPGSAFATSDDAAPGGAS